MKRSLRQVVALLVAFGALYTGLPVMVYADSSQQLAGLLRRAKSRRALAASAAAQSAKKSEAAAKADKPALPAELLQAAGQRPKLFEKLRTRREERKLLRGSPAKVPGAGRLRKR